MKIDKETLVKNRYWILVGTAAGLTLIGWLLLVFTVPSTVAKAVTDVETPWKKDKKYNDFKNPALVKQMTDATQKLEAEYATLHKKLYDSQIEQTCLMTWPKAMVDQGFDFKNGKFAKDVTVQKKGDPKTDDKWVKGQPPDSPDRLAGTLIDNSESWFKVKDRNGTIVTFMRRLDTKVIFADAPEKKAGSFGPSFGDLGTKKMHNVIVNFAHGRYFGEDLTEYEIRAYRDTYKDQLLETLAEIGAVNAVNEPVVLLRYIPFTKVVTKAGRADLSGDNWIYKPDKLPPSDNRFFSYVSANSLSHWPDNWHDISSEEIWAAQENLWIQREIYRQIKAINDSVAAFTPVTGNKAGKDGWTKFRNYYWEIELKVTDPGAQAKVAAKLKNLRPVGQSVNNLRFLLRFKDPNDKNAKVSDPLLFPPREPVDRRFLGAVVDVAGSPNDTFPPKGDPKDYVEFDVQGPLTEPLFSVDQMLTVETAAVKRLDMLNVAMSPFTGETAISHYHSVKPQLESFKKKPPPPTPKAGTVAKADENIGAPPPPGAGDPPPEEIADDGTPLAGLDPSLTGALKLSLNHLVLDRYLKKTLELRQLPISLVMVVGQEHMNRVTAGMANSPLRFLPAQVLWQRCNVPITGAAASKTGAAAASASEGQENIEMTIYGVITIYDRPGRPFVPDVPPPAGTKK
jgi:hypothetical protein